MNARIIYIFAALCLVCKSSASGIEFSISPDEATNAQSRLKAYNAGSLTLHQLFGENPQENCREMIDYYLANTNRITAKEKLAI
ncbi:MAG TPA: hypothetical protein VMH87_07200, partial [Pseudomonadales bacterium]|nr:hypothetical protein [Pseudomonadales bacterium]